MTTRWRGDIDDEDAVAERDLTHSPDLSVVKWRIQRTMLG